MAIVGIVLIDVTIPYKKHTPYVIIWAWIYARGLNGKQNRRK